MCPHEIMQRKKLISERSLAVTSKKGQRENHLDEQEEEKELILGGAEIVKNMVL